MSQRTYKSIPEALQAERDKEERLFRDMVKMQGNQQLACNNSDRILKAYHMILENVFSIRLLCHSTVDVRQ